MKPIRTDDDSSDSEDDSWLDDEQWYCEHLAQWSGRVKVTAAVQQNSARLKDFLMKNVSWREIACETKKLSKQIKLPECSDDWEDDDKLGCDDADE